MECVSCYSSAQWEIHRWGGALMYFRSVDDLENYKTSGAYKKLVESLSEAWLDESKPVSDHVYKIQDI